VIATAKTHRNYRVHDDNGVEISECAWADTETGEVVVLFRDAEGRIQRVPGEDGGMELRKEWQQHPAPLRLVPREAVS
jgi:hypothetical protein